MTDNEKAAIAAGLWANSGSNSNEAIVRVCGGGCEHGSPVTHYVTKMAPDMHDPANLWRALEAYAAHLKAEIAKDPSIVWYAKRYMNLSNQLRDALNRPEEFDEFLFAALVALYDAEHKE